MGICLQCNKWIQQPKGKRSKKFCNNTCRSNFWYSKNKKGIEQPVQLVKPLPVVYDASRLPDNFKGDEPLSFERMKQEMTEKASPSGYEQQLHAAKTQQELEKVGAAIKKSGLSWLEKNRLQQVGQTIFNDKFSF